MSISEKYWVSLLISGLIAGGAFLYAFSPKDCTTVTTQEVSNGGQIEKTIATTTCV